MVMEMLRGREYYSMMSFTTEDQGSEAVMVENRIGQNRTE